MSEENKTYALDDLLLKNELEAITQLLHNVTTKYSGNNLVGYVDAANIVLKTLLRILPREVARRAEQVPVLINDPPADATSDA